MFKAIPRISITPIPDFFPSMMTCLKDGKIFNGKDIENFEHEFAKYVGVKNAIAVSSGRYAMELILKSLNLKNGEEILLPSYTLRDLVPIIKKIGLKPKFVDIEAQTFNINANQIEQKITKNTKAILATHLFGLPCDMKKIMEIAKKHHLQVIEDCTHSLGAMFFGKKVGSIGTAGFFSLEVMKPINTFGGGVITTNDGNLAQEIRNDVKKNDFSLKLLLTKILFTSFEYVILNSFLCNIALRFLSSERFGEKIRRTYQKSHRFHSRKNTKFTNLQAVLGLNQLNIIEKRNSQRIEKAKLYKNLLRNISKIDLPQSPKRRKHIFYNFIITLDKNAPDFSIFLRKNKIDATIGNNIMQNCIDTEINKYPITKLILKKAVKVPLNDNITDKEIEYVAKTIKSYYKNL